MVIDATCEQCGETFSARQKNAKWCSDRCRKAWKPAEVPEDRPEPDPDPDALNLVESVRSELQSAGRLGTFNGQLALQLAKRLANPDESGISSLSKELRTVMAAALEGAGPAPAEVEDEEVEDEVTQARRQREQARQAAGLA